MVEAIPAGAATAVIPHWTGQNYHYLLAAIEQVAAFLQPEALTTAPPEPLNPPAAIEQLCKLLGLSQFERSLLLLCAGMELHSEIAKLEIFPGQFITPTFSLSLSRLPHPHWSATTPESPLRRWHLVELGDAPTLSHRPLRINERILHFLVGDTQLELQLLGIVTALPINPFPLPPSQQQLVMEIATLFQQASSPPLVQLSGADSAMKQAIAAAVCAELGYGLLHLTAELLPADFQQFRSIQTLWQREAILTHSLLLLDCDNMAEPTEAANPAPAQTSAITRMMEACQQPMFVFSRDRRSARQRPVFSRLCHIVTIQQQQAVS